MAIVGSDAQIEFTFTALGTSTPADPTEVFVIHRKPDLTETEYEYLVDSEITRVSTGLYRFTINLVDHRTHIFRPVGTGAVNDAKEVTLEVTESYFLDPIPG